MLTPESIAKAMISGLYVWDMEKAISLQLKEGENQIEELYFGLANIMIDLNENKEALSFIEKALAIKPDIRYLISKGNALSNIGELKDNLVSFYEDVLKQYPRRFLQKAVLEKNADVGIAFDGDGDRLIMVDGKGQLVDGDQVLYLILKLYQQQKIMSGGVVGTLMTNLAFEEKCKELDIPFLRADVGDKYVAEALLKG